MADQEHIEFKIVTSGELTDFRSEDTFLMELEGAEENNGWQVIGFTYGPGNCYRALLRKGAYNG
jgi:hypothetical protein